MSIENTYVLVTGASSGIGAEFARQYAAAGYNLVLTARREQALKELADQLRSTYAVQVEVIAADLLVAHDVERLTHRLAQNEHPVEILVNNAGFGLGQRFEDAPTQRHLDQVQVLAAVPLQLMHTALLAMLPRGRGRIINVASVAAFTPGGTYSAVKRFMVVVSESANLQYRSRGIHVTAVCPGLTHSEFHDAMGQSRPNVPAIFWLNPQQVVAEAIAAVATGKPVCIPSLPYKVAVGISRAVPRRAVAAFIARTRNY